MTNSRSNTNKCLEANAFETAYVPGGHREEKEIRT